MNAERWQKIKAIFDSVLDASPDERADLARKACGGDDKLLSEVTDLLRSFEKAGSFIEEPAAGEVASLILEPNSTLKPGQRFGHYEIQSLLGSGGMGEVYLATDGKLGRHVAIKILNEEFSRNESNVQRFIQEAKAASSLNHPNILVIHEIKLGDDANYIVSEYVEGLTLRQVMQKAKLKTSEMLDIAVQIADALIAAHGANIVHRDIKPENIVVRPDDYVKVLDFGLAKLVEPKSTAAGSQVMTAKQNRTAQGIVMGTVNYMSPEQAKAEAVDQRTDIFSLGVVLYEMIAGRTPFQGDSMSETLANLINAEPQPLSRYASNVQDELQRIITKSLRKKREDRYQTSGDLRADLKALRENLKFDERSNASHQESATGRIETVGQDANRATGEENFRLTGQSRRRRPMVALAAVAAAIVLAGLGYYYFLSPRLSAKHDGKRTLAVLPFLNTSQDPNAEYLSDGISESVINNLSQLSSLKVMSRNSAFRFRNDQSDTRGIASQLGVEVLVTGDIKQLGDKLVINVRLIDASDESQIWGNQFVKASTDIIATQNEIAQAVAQNLRIQLTTADRQRLNKRYTENAEAYSLYLRGRFHVFKLTPPDVQAGIGYFQQAIGLDPNYALAYAGLSDAYRSLAIGVEIDSVRLLANSKAAAQKAIEIDDSLSEGHVALGTTAFWGDWDWVLAEAEFKRAIELNPSNPGAHLFYAHLLSNLGRHSEALAEAKIGQELDLLFPFGNALVGQFQANAGLSDEGLATLAKASELAPTFWMPHLFAANAYTDKGMFAEALAETRKASSMPSTQTYSYALEVYLLAKLGRTDEARTAFASLLNRSNVPMYHIAIAYGGLGEKEKAIESLEQAFDKRDPKMTFLKVDAKFNDLRMHPGFIALMKRMNL